MAEAKRIRNYFARYRGAFIAGLVVLLVSQSLSLSVPRILRYSTDAILAEDFVLATRTAWLLVGAAVLGAITRIASRLLIFNSGRRVEFHLRQECYEHLLRLAPAFFQRLPPGQVMSRLVNDLTQVRLLLGPGILNVTNTALTYVIILPLLAFSSLKLTLICLLPYPILLLLGRLFGRHIYAASRVVQQRLGSMSSRVQENLSNALTVRTYGQEAREQASFEALNGAYQEAQMKLVVLRGVTIPILSTAGVFGALVTLYVGAHEVQQGRMSVGQVVEFQLYLAALAWPTIALGWILTLFQRSAAALHRMNEIFCADPEIRHGAMRDVPSHDIALCGVSITHEGSATPALAEVSAEIPEGSVCVLAGPVGSGKSTLIETLARLVDVGPGKYTIGGIDVCELALDTARSQFAYSSQTAFMFSRSVRENLRFAAPNASDAALDDVIRIAGLKDDIENFPDGLDTPIGERGLTLSGGQRQRLALARAVLSDAPCILLDDSLSAVDADTEERILKALLSERAKRTLIIATHRLSIAQHADQILVLEQGRIVERGNFQALCQAGGLFAQMWRQSNLRQSIDLEVSEAP